MNEKRYVVWFRDCESQVDFDEYKDAKHYARSNGGIIHDRETGENMDEYADTWD